MIGSISPRLARSNRHPGTNSLKVGLGYFRRGANAVSTLEFYIAGSHDEYRLKMRMVR